MAVFALKNIATRQILSILTNLRTSDMIRARIKATSYMQLQTLPVLSPMSLGEYQLQTHMVDNKKLQLELCSIPWQQL